MKKTVKVVVIDDSAYNRRAITKMLEGIPEVEVIGYAADGEEGIRKIVDLKPDLVTLDLEMPKMDGFTLLRVINAKCPVPVIVISARNDDERVFKALELGAVDFIPKPTTSISIDLLKIQADLQQKVRSVCNLNMAALKPREEAVVTDRELIRRSRSQVVPPKKLVTGFEVVAIGSSTGGPPALQTIFSAFTDKLPFAMVVAQHMPEGFTKAFADRLNRFSAFEIKEAEDGDLIKPGRILVASGGKNLILQKAEGDVVARLQAPTTKDKYIPSVDVLFESCAKIYGDKLLGVVLTGMGNDGSRGVRAIKAAGGSVLAESRESAVVFGMPREAIATGSVDKILTLDGMAREILIRCGVIAPHD